MGWTTWQAAADRDDCRARELNREIPTEMAMLGKNDLGKRSNNLVLGIC
jgi:hypothetical protein